MLLLPLVLDAVSGPDASLSALMGGAAAFIPNLLFAACSARNNPKKNARQVVAAFYRGEIFKLALAALLFAMAFRYSGLVLWSFFTGYALVIAMVWFALLLRK